MNANHDSNFQFYLSKQHSLIILFVSLWGLFPLDSISISKDFNALQWDWAPEQIIGSDPNHYNRYISIKLPKSCASHPERILAGSQHLMLAYPDSNSTFSFLPWVMSSPKTVWVYNKSNTWTQIKNIPHHTSIKWLYAFSVDNTLVFDVLLENRASAMRYLRRYWIRTDQISCVWQDLYKGEIIDVTALTSNRDRSYRYVYILEPGKVHKLDLLRLTTLSMNTPQDSIQLKLEGDALALEDEGWLIVSSAKTSIRLKASTLTP